MEILYNTSFVLHMIGIIGIFAGYFIELFRGTKGINPGMLHGASLQVATGLIMVDLRAMNLVPSHTDPLNYSIVFVKFAISVGILSLCVMGRRAAGPKTKWWTGVGVLTLINVVIATMISG